MGQTRFLFHEADGSVVLMAGVIVLTAVQFRFLGRRTVS